MVGCNIERIFLRLSQICDFIFHSVVSSFFIDNWKIIFIFCGKNCVLTESDDQSIMPTIIGMPTASHRSARHARANIEQDGGIKICCCRMFTCVNLNFLSTNHGLMKVSEVILGSCCQTLLVRFGMESAADIGQAFNTCFTTVSSCLMTSSLLLFCYILSTRTFNLVRQSLFVSIINNRLKICFVFMVYFDENYCKSFFTKHIEWQNSRNYVWHWYR